jgi:hypothetical protein
MSKTDDYSVKENPKPYISNVCTSQGHIFIYNLCFYDLQDVVHIHIMSSKQHIMKYSTSN